MKALNISAPQIIKRKKGEQEQHRDDSEKEGNSEEELSIQVREEVNQMNLYKLITNKDLLFDKIKQLAEESINLISRTLFKEANYFLEQAEEIIEFAANRGKYLDRNLIITVLFNRACSYQGLWKLDKCNKYIDAVIYNIEQSLKNEMDPNNNIIQSNQLSIANSNKLSYRIKRQTFLVQCYLQQCAILSQLVKHDKAIQTSKKAIGVLYQVFESLLTSSKGIIKQATNVSSLSTTAVSSKIQKYEPSQLSPRSLQRTSSNSNSEKVNGSPSIALLQKNELESQNIPNSPRSVSKEEVNLQKIISQSALDLLNKFEQKSIFDQNAIFEGSKQLSKTKKAILAWRNNPDNNEKSFKSNNSQVKNINKENQKSESGIQMNNEWIEQFNIGSIMHMTSVTYQQFSTFEDILFELSKRQILERMLFLSICFFTIATEIRFVELDIQKSQSKGQSYDLMKQEAYQQSEIYHLKSIEIVCQAVTCYSPYVTHLINSYHKHYNASLDMIEEEVSILSQCSHTEQQFAKYKEYSNNKGDHQDLTETSDTSGYQKNNEDFLPKHILNNHSNKLLTPSNNLSKRNETQQLEENRYGKKSPLNGLSTVKERDQFGQKQQDLAFDHADGVPIIQTIKINKNNPAFQKKAPELDLELKKITIDQSNVLGGQGSTKNQRDVHTTGTTAVRKQSPMSYEEQKKGIRQKENQDQKYQQSNNNSNNSNLNQVLQSGSTRPIQGQIKTVYQGKGSPTSSSTSLVLQSPQQFSPQNISQQPIQLQQGQQIFQGHISNHQQQSSSPQASTQQQVQYQPLSQTQQFSAQTIQQIQYLQQHQAQQLAEQQGQYLKQIPQNSQPVGSTQFSMQVPINSQPVIKPMSNSAVQLHIQNPTIQQRGMRNFNELDFKMYTNDNRSPDDKSGSSTYRSVNGQNGKVITSSSPDPKQQSNIQKNVSTQRTDPNNNFVQKQTISQQQLQQQQQLLQQQQLQQQNYQKQMAQTAAQTLKNGKVGELNNIQKQGHNFLQQFDFVSKSPGNSPSGSKELPNNQAMISGRINPQSASMSNNTNGMKAIPKLDFNQISNAQQIKIGDDNVRFFSARDNTSKKINNLATKI